MFHISLRKIWASAIALCKGKHLHLVWIKKYSDRMILDFHNNEYRLTISRLTMYETKQRQLEKVIEYLLLM